MATGRDLGKAYVSIVPDTEKFKPELEAALKKAVSGTSAKIDVKADTKGVTDAVKKAKAETESTKASVKIDGDTSGLTDSVKKSKVVVSKDLENLRNEARAILKDGLDFHIDADDTKARAKIDKFRSSLTELAHMKVEADPDVSAVAVAKAQSKISALKASLDAFGREEVHADADITTGPAMAKLSEAMAALGIWGRMNKAAKASVDTSGSGKLDWLKEKVAAFGRMRATAKVWVDTANAKSSILRFFGGGDGGELAKAAGAGGFNAGKKSGSMFKSGFGTGLPSGVLIPLAVAALGALPAAIGAVGAAAGVGLGAGIIALAVSEISKNGKAITAATKRVTADQNRLATAQGSPSAGGNANSILSRESSNAVLANSIKQLEAQNKLTAAQKATLSNDKIKLKYGEQQLDNIKAQGGAAKTASAAKIAADQQQLKSDQQTLKGLQEQQKQLAKFQQVYNDLKDSWKGVQGSLFTAVADSGFLKSADNAVKSLSGEFKKLEPSLQRLFAGSAPLIQPFVNMLLNLVKGVLPGLNEMLQKSGGAIGGFVQKLGQVVGSGIGGWFKAAIPWFKQSADFFLLLMRGAGGLGSALIALGGAVASILTPVLKALAPVFNALFGALGKTGGTMLSILIPALNQIAPPLGKLIAMVLQVSGSFTNVLLKAMAPVIEGFAEILGAMLRFATRHPTVVKAITAIIIAWRLLNMAFAVSPWGLAITAAIVAVSLIVKYWKPITHFFEGLWNGIVGAFKTGINWIKEHWKVLLLSVLLGPLGGIAALFVTHGGAIVNGLITGIKKAGPWLLEAMIDLVRRPIQAFLKFLGIASPSKLFAGFGRNIVEGLVNGIKGMASAVWGAITAMAGYAVKGAKVLTAAIGASWNWMKGVTRDAWGAVREAVVAVFRFFTIGVVLEAKLFTAVIGASWNWIKGVSRSSWGVIKAVVKAVFDFFKTVAVNDAKFFTAAVGASWNWIKNVTSDVWNGIKNFFVNWWNTVKNLSSGSVNWIGSKIHSAWNAVFGVTRSVFGGVEDFFKGFWKRLKNGFQDVVDGIKGIWNKVGGAVRGPLVWMNDNIYHPFAHIVNSGLGIFGVKAKLPADLIHKAAGGMIDGKGTGISDEVPAMLSHGEYVLKASTVRRIGKRNLDALNGYSGIDQGTSERPHFASGGQLVGDAERYRGHRYVWGGGANPQTGWDCSSFMSYILGKNGGSLPGGFHAPSLQHGPTAAQFRNGSPLAMGSVRSGDIAVEKNGGHVGMVAANGTSDAQSAIQGFAAIGRAYGTNYQTFGKGSFDFYKNPDADNRGFFGKLWDGIKGAWGAATSVLSNVAQEALNGITGLLGKTIPGDKKTIPPQLAQGVISKFLNAGQDHVNNNPNNWTSGAPGTGANGGDPGFNAAAVGAAQKYAKSQLGRYGWGSDQFGPLKALWNKESSWNANAVNPSSGAYGIPQALGKGHPYNLGDYVSQINWGLNYIKGRYGNPAGAWAHEQANNWYAQGGLVGKGFFGGGNVHGGMPSADKWNVNVSEGERVLTRSQNQKYEKVDPTPQLLQTLISEVQAMKKYTAHAAKNTGDTAAAVSGKSPSLRRLM